MPLLMEISYRGVEKTPYLEGLIRGKVEKLRQVCSYLSSCRVAVEKPQEHQRSGSGLRVRINLTVPPCHELAACREPGDGDLHDELPAVLKSAFDAARRQLQELTERQRGDVKAHPSNEANGVVDRLFPAEDYGFIKDQHGRQIYFHRHSVTADDFDRLETGTVVRFEVETGREGPQARVVQIRDKRPHSPTV